MDRSYPYSRRLAKRTLLQKRVAAMLALGAAGCAILYFWSAAAPPTVQPAAPTALAAIAATTQADAATAVQRRIYPYSIVPGGVSDAKELRRVIREDKVVAAHYAEFDLSKAHEKTVTTPRAVHVSYRKGDKVYWTAKKVMLAEGETLLSDGSHEARARCANQISDTPRLPVEAHGPSAEELDSSIVDKGADGSFEHVSAAMADDEGVAGGFLNAPGSGTAGGILADGSAAEAGSLFAAGANVPDAARGAFSSVRSGSGRAPAAQDGADGSDAGSGGSGSGATGGSGTGSTGGSSPAPSTPVAGAPGNSSPEPTPAPQTATPQPAAPGSPNTPGAPTTPIGGSNPAAPGGTPSTPSRPVQTAPSTPDGGNQSGGGSNETPSAPAPDAGGTPANPGIPGGGPDSSPAPQPTLDAPQDPTPPRQEPAAPTEVPEPGSAWLVGAALGLMLVLRRQRRPGIKQES